MVLLLPGNKQFRDDSPASKDTMVKGCLAFHITGIYIGPILQEELYHAYICCPACKMKQWASVKTFIHFIMVLIQT